MRTLLSLLASGALLLILYIPSIHTRIQLLAHPILHKLPPPRSSPLYLPIGKILQVRRQLVPCHAHSTHTHSYPLHHLLYQKQARPPKKKKPCLLPLPPSPPLAEVISFSSSSSSSSPLSSSTSMHKSQHQQQAQATKTSIYLPRYCIISIGRRLRLRPCPQENCKR